MKPIFNALEYDGINSKDQDIYITGKSVYNAPERDVEFIEIAGRSGDFALDKGRWKNQEVTYTAGTFGQDQAEFASKIRQFRNLLVSRYGYHRLVDTYNPEEYRLAIFKNAIEVEAEGRKRAGEFELVFNCNPKHYLMSGDSEIAVTSGEELFNPTPFDASPLLAVKGYGTIEFNGYTIELRNETLGDIELDVNPEDYGYRWTIPIPNDVLNQGDTITVSGATDAIRVGYDVLDHEYFRYPLANNPTNTKTGVVVNISGNDIAGEAAALWADIVLPSIQFSAGTSSTWTNVTTFANEPLYNDSLTQIGTITITVTQTATYTATAGNGGTIELTDSISLTTTGSATKNFRTSKLSMGRAVAESTVSLIGDPTYIDCDLGEAYMIKDGSYIGLNGYIDLGSDLPTFASGNNEITFDNTVTELKITPRWWML